MKAVYFLCLIVPQVLCFYSQSSIDNWLCGKPNVFKVSNSSQNLDWTFTTDSCLLNHANSLNTSRFEVVLTPLFDPLMEMTADCQNQFYPKISFTLTDVNRHIIFSATSSSEGFVSIQLPKESSSNRRLYEGRVSIERTTCREKALKFSLLAQFTSLSSSLTETEIGPFLQRGKVNTSEERLFIFYPLMDSYINNEHRDIFISLTTKEVLRYPVRRTDLSFLLFRVLMEICL